MTTVQAPLSTVCAAYFFAFCVTAGAFTYTVMTGRSLWIPGAALLGGIIGILVAMLDHTGLRVKDEVLGPATRAQYAYLAVRASVALLLGYGAAIVAETVITAKPASGSPEMYAVIAFATAYLFDASKLALGK